MFYYLSLLIKILFMCWFQMVGNFCCEILMNFNDEERGNEVKVNRER